MAVSRGEIYFARLDPVLGREQAGVRPIVVVSDDQAINQQPLVVIVVVGTSGWRVRKDYPINARVGPHESGLTEETVFLCFQVRALDESRLVRPRAGVLTAGAMARVETALRRCMLLSVVDQPTSFDRV